MSRHHMKAPMSPISPSPVAQLRLSERKVKESFEKELRSYDLTKEHKTTAATGSIVMTTTIVPTAKATPQKKQGIDPMKEKLLQWRKEKELNGGVSPSYSSKRKSSLQQPFENTLRAYNSSATRFPQHCKSTTSSSRSVTMLGAHQSVLGSVHQRQYSKVASRTPSHSPMKLFNKPVVTPTKDSTAVFIEAIEERIEQLYFEIIEGTKTEKLQLRREILGILQACGIRIVKGLMIDGMECIKLNQQLWYIFLMSFDFKQLWKNNAIQFLREHSIMQEDYLNIVEKKVSLIPEIAQIIQCQETSTNEEIQENQQQFQQNDNNRESYDPNIDEQMARDDKKNIEESSRNNDLIIEDGKSGNKEDKVEEDQKINSEEIRQIIVIVEDEGEGNNEEEELGIRSQDDTRNNCQGNQILAKEITGYYERNEEEKKGIEEIQMVEERHSPLREVQEQEEIPMELEEDVSSGAKDTQLPENPGNLEICNLDQEFVNASQENTQLIEEQLSDKMEIKEYQQQLDVLDAIAISEEKVKELLLGNFPQFEEAEIIENEENQELQLEVQSNQQQEQQLNDQPIASVQQAGILRDQQAIHDWTSQSVNRRLDFCQEEEEEEEEEEEVTKNVQRDTEVNQYEQQLDQEILLMDTNSTQDDTLEAQCEINNDLFEKEQQQEEEEEQLQQAHTQPLAAEEEEEEQHKEEIIYAANHLGVEQIKSEQTDSMLKCKNQMSGLDIQRPAYLRSATETMPENDNFILIISDDDDDDEDEGIIGNHNQNITVQPQILSQSSVIHQVITVEDYSPEVIKTSTQAIQAVSCFESFFTNPRKDQFQECQNITRDMDDNAVQINKDQSNVYDSKNNILLFPEQYPAFNNVVPFLENVRNNENIAADVSTAITREQEIMNYLLSYIPQPREEIEESISTVEENNVIANSVPQDGIKHISIEEYLQRAIIGKIKEHTNLNTCQYSHKKDDKNTHAWNKKTLDLKTALNCQIPSQMLVNVQDMYSPKNGINRKDNRISAENQQQNNNKAKRRQRSVSFSLKNSSNNNKNKQEEQQVNRSAHKSKESQQQYQPYQDLISLEGCSPFRQPHDADVSHSELSIISKVRHKRKSILGLDISEINSQLIQNSGSLYVLTNLPQQSQQHPQSPHPRVNSPEQHRYTRSASQKKISASVAPSLLCSPINIVELSNTQEHFSRLLDDDQISTSQFQWNDGIWQRRSIRISNNLYLKGLRNTHNESNNNKNKKSYKTQRDQSQKQIHSHRYNTPVKQKKQFQSINLCTPTKQ